MAVREFDPVLELEAPALPLIEALALAPVPPVGEDPLVRETGVVG